MPFRRRIIWTSVAIAVVLTIGVLATAGAQAQRLTRLHPTDPLTAPKICAPYSSTGPGIWECCGVDEHELVVSLEYIRERAPFR